MKRLVLIPLILTLTACSDPQHGAWKVKSGIWMGSLLLLVALLGAGVGGGGFRLQDDAASSVCSSASGLQPGPVMNAVLVFVDAFCLFVTFWPRKKVQN